jgi:hypothetical protein
MRYNPRLLNSLIKSEPFVDFNRTDIAEEKKIFDTQLQASIDIVKSMTAHTHPEDEDSARNRHIILLAQMQSGKTGAINGVVNILESNERFWANYFKINKYFFVTGMNDNGLHEQTTKRILEQVIGATDANVDHGSKDKNKCDECKFIVHKNYDLRNSPHKLEKCVIFVDECHYGSGKNTVLTNFFKSNNIDWKNSNLLSDKNIFIVSVSATPLDEIHSDRADSKQVVVLKTGENYYGVMDFYQNNQLMGANNNDFKESKKTKTTPIFEYIEDALENMPNGKGVIFIRAQGKKSKVIEEDSWISENFKLVELNAKNGRIDYERVKLEIKAMHTNYGSKDEKPIIFMVKGAYRAGMSIDQKDKDQVYMVYDYSKELHAQPQGLMGRMCGYRKDLEFAKITKFYVNYEISKQYSEWVESDLAKEKTPTTIAWVDKDEVTTNQILDFSDSDIRLTTKKIETLKISLDDDDLKCIMGINKKGIEKKILLREFIKNKLPDFSYDFISETYLSGINNYQETVIDKWFSNSSISTPRPNKDFKNKFNRISFDFKEDDGRTFIHVLLDDENYDLILVFGMLSQQYRKKDNTRLYKEHKDTVLV